MGLAFTLHCTVAQRWQCETAHPKAPIPAILSRISLFLDTSIHFYGQVFLWEGVEGRDVTAVRDDTFRGRWAQIYAPGDVALPSSQDKETAQHIAFIQTEVIITNIIE